MGEAQAARHAGDLIRYWRRARHLSQLELGLRADVSTRHLSFLETGKSQPSREMLLVLARVLDIPPRERNALFGLAGLAAPLRETPLDDPDMAGMREAIGLLLRSFHPHLAAAVDGVYDVVMMNQSFARLHQMLTGEMLAPYELVAAPRPNVIASLFDPALLRPVVANWPEVALATLDRLQRERARAPRLGPLIDRLLDDPDVAALRHVADRERPAALVIPLELDVGGLRLSFFSTITTIGTPQDLTLAELHIETFHPADEATGAFLAQLG